MNDPARGDAVPIDFTLTSERLELQATTREIAQRVLGDADASTRHLATPQERFAATRPLYEQLVEASRGAGSG
jgi:hypothetical protein